ncbi:glycoside hydrolase family 31 protein [Marilutibacter chinensis]|uniref:PA14 domain-containing protein n=1 Tax=Marilutibacter chinensis TaxID=2912247 RepID=A0ABS9HMZ6_9GAMM|nr:TIM-barrel domain-containing protein [Lysobacter chinensis]MCF7220381.1 PA14 domain-containing protein [Lysobacter chinensis]
MIHSTIRRMLAWALAGVALAAAGPALAREPSAIGQSAHELPVALDAAGQLKQLVVESRAGFGWLRVAGGVQFQTGGMTKNVLFYGSGIVRVSAHKGESHTRQPSLVVVASPQESQLDVEESADALTIAGAGLRVIVDKSTGTVAFQRLDGTPLVREQDAPVLTPAAEPSGTETYAVEQRFALTPDESLYGLGQYNEPYMDYRGRDVLMVQTNIGIVVPFMVSTRRYGLLWDTYSKMTFSDGPRGAVFRAENAPAGVDYYLVAGDTMDGVIAGYRHLTGAAPMFPKYAFGLFMSKERYATQQRLLEVVRRFRRERFPLDVIVQDWQYWGGQKDGQWDGNWSGMIWDPERYPDPAGMVRTLHEDLHTRLMVSIWPSVGNDTALAGELDARGLRFEPLHWISGRARIYDAFSDEGRAIYFKHAKKGLFDIGVDALWMDGTEVEVGGAAHDPAEVEADIKRLGRNAMGDFGRYLNIYSLLTTRGIYEGHRASADLADRRVFTLTRSAWAGQQRHAALPWSGDTTAGWAALRAQIAGGLNVSMAGLPYWTQDVGGFFVNAPGGERDPAYRELFARWNQFGVFNPVYRIHGTSIEREPWVFKALEPEVYRSIRRAAELRYRLLPYIYSLAWASTHDGYTMMRGLAMDFPDQPALRRVDDTYMFGPAFLVQPITRPMFHAELPPPPTVPAAQLRTSDGRPGLELEYYRGTEFEEFASRTIDTQAEHHWPGPPLDGVPPGLAGLQNFSARWRGQIIAAEDGEHEIGVEGDDGFRVWLDDELVVDEWKESGARFAGARMLLRKGQAVRVRIDYFQKGGGRSMRLAWRTPGERHALEEHQRQLDPRQATLLPAGTDWYDFWTGQRHAGGASAARRYAIDEFPLFVRAGSIVPLGPLVQHVDEKPDAPYEVRIYPGADGRFTLYDDDGETYAYENGEYATVALAWDDARRALRIGARKGSFPGMVGQRTLNVRLMPSAPGDRAQIRTVRFHGEPIELQFTP